MLNKKKILYITANTAFGGVTFYTKSLAQKALDLGWDVFYETSHIEVIEELDLYGINFVSFNTLGRSINPFKDIIALFQLYHFIKSERFDIVHTNTSKGGILGRVAARLAGVENIIHTVQGFAFHEFSAKYSTYILSKIEKIAAFFCHRVIFVNKDDIHFSKENRIVSIEKMSFIPNGVDAKIVRATTNQINQFRKELCDELGIQMNSKLIGSIARLSPQKGTYYLIEAFIKLSQSNPDAYLLIIGDGELMGSLKKFASDYTNDKIKFLGTRKDNKRMLNALDIYVLPSLWEGLSLSLLESMAVGLPIIATDIKGNREAINNTNGILVEPKSSEEIYHALKLYLSNKSLAKNKGENARNDFDSNFSLQAMLKSTFDLYML